MQINEAITALQQRVNIASTIDEITDSHLAQLLTTTASKQPENLAFTSLGHSINFAQLNALSDAFAIYIQQHTDLQKGDRLAIQLPNVIQYPVVFFGAIKAGLVVVNTNPLYTERELVHQFNDSGAKALVVLANVAHSVQDVIPKTGIRHVIVTEIADLHGTLSRTLINFAMRYIKRAVPAYSIPNALTLRGCLKLGQKGEFQDPNIAVDDLALLQYTGGTTGLSKGAMLSHRSLLSNVAQQKLLFKAFGAPEDEVNSTAVLPLPLYHIFACSACAFLVSQGRHCLLIANPRDLPSMVKTMSAWPFSVFYGLNTLFVALCARDDFKALDFSNLSMTVSGGMALTSDAAQRWHDTTGVEINEGYGLTETSPVVSINTGGAGRKLGSIGVTAPGTELKVIDGEGNALPCGEKGELCVRGPQVMQGYWQQPEKSAEVLSADGWFATGDIAVIDEDGFPQLVDRKKDMIIVSGFNVYPNELENVISSHDKVLECAVIGVKDERAGEKVKVYVVKSDPSLSSEEIIAYCRTQLTPYKVPSEVAFIDDLPKSNVGKILRRELRDADASNSA